MCSGGIKYFYKVHEGKVKDLVFIFLSCIWNLSLKLQYDLKLHCDPTYQCSSEAGTKDSGHSILLTTIVTILFTAVNFLTILLEDMYDSGIFENVVFPWCSVY